MTKPTFDMDAAIAALKAGKCLTGKDGILTPLIKQLTEAAMQAELEQHLENDEDSNRKNGSTPKTVKSAAGSFELNTPRDRAGTFEPQIVKKHQTHLTDELERKIIGLFALGQLRGLNTWAKMRAKRDSPCVFVPANAVSDYSGLLATFNALPRQSVDDGCQSTASR